VLGTAINEVPVSIIADVDSLVKKDLEPNSASEISIYHHIMLPLIGYQCNPNPLLMSPYLMYYWSKPPKVTFDC